MDTISSPKFAKALLGFAISFFTVVMMVMVTAIVIYTGQPVGLCTTFGIITLLSIASTMYFMCKIVESSK